MLNSRLQSFYTWDWRYLIAVRALIGMPVDRFGVGGKKGEFAAIVLN